MLEKEYIRERAVMYARKYALVRNPLFYSFAGIGGNCTNFVSQCVLAGSCVMNFTAIYGWYYLSTTRRSASWTGVEYFYNFMTQNDSLGPYGVETTTEGAEIGDVIQLANEAGDFYHTVIISEIDENGEIYICANSNDALDKPLSEYNYFSLRVIHILGVRYDTRFQIDCFDSLYSPPLPPIVPPEEPSEEPSENPPSTEAPEPSPNGEVQDQEAPPTQNGTA
ncbi:MAG: amidase domain-containing protein [Clostridia bacterium]|nr:amidase domain-containing protein [Clostridia bacterium]